MFDGRDIYFAGGGTGGHIYPAIAIADRIRELSPSSSIKFLCSQKQIDKNILAGTGYEFMAVKGVGFSINPVELIKFLACARDSAAKVGSYFKNACNPILISSGGYVSVGPVWAASKAAVPVFMLNIDMTAGKANRVFARYADKIFVQFEETLSSLGRNRFKAYAVGCPLRDSFQNADKQKAIDQLGIAPDKKVLLITGASSGSVNINNAIARMVDKLSSYSDSWQVVHLTGSSHKQAMQMAYAGAKMKFTVVDYYEDMADLLACADLVIGRAGAVSVAEYAASAVPAICMPYPYHSDNHQMLNARRLVEAGSAVIVEDLKDAHLNALNLWPVLKNLLDDESERLKMARAAETVAKKDAADVIAREILQYAPDLLNADSVGIDRADGVSEKETSDRDNLDGRDDLDNDNIPNYNKAGIMAE